MLNIEKSQWFQHIPIHHTCKCNKPGVHAETFDRHRRRTQYYNEIQCRAYPANFLNDSLLNTFTLGKLSQIKTWKIPNKIPKRENSQKIYGKTRSSLKWRQTLVFGAELAKFLKQADIQYWYLIALSNITEIFHNIFQISLTKHIH